MAVSVPLCRSGSEYPKDAFEGLSLSIKEAAPGMDAALFTEVR